MEDLEQGIGVKPFPAAVPSMPAESIIPQSHEPHLLPIIPEKPAVVGSVNLLDWDEEPANFSKQATKQPSLVLKEFNPSLMNPQLFQQKWAILSDFINTKLTGLKGSSFNIQTIEENLRSNKVNLFSKSNIPHFLIRYSSLLQAYSILLLNLPQLWARSCLFTLLKSMTC